MTMNLSWSILYTTMQEDPLLFLAPKDDDNFSYGSFTD